MTALSLILGFSTAAYICSFMFVRVFDNYIPSEGSSESGVEDAASGMTGTSVVEESNEPDTSGIPEA